MLDTTDFLTNGLPPTLPPGAVEIVFDPHVAVAMQCVGLACAILWCLAWVMLAEWVGGKR